MTSLQAISVSIDLGGQRIVRDVSVSLGEGRLIGLIGANGAGKSTLIRGLCRLLPASAGEVLLNGRPLGAYKRKELARLIGYLPQGHGLDWPLEVEQLVALGRLPHVSPFASPSAQDAQAIARAMQRSEISGFAKRAADTLSGGERARVMLARVLASEAPILFVDEPVASLDPYHQLHVMELLHDLARDGKLVICVLHDLPLAARFCDELVLMQDGQVIRQGAVDDVLGRDHLHTAYRVEGVYGENEGKSYVLPWRRVSETGPAS